METCVDTNNYTQSQCHGFYFENEIRHNMFQLPKTKNDTKTHDILHNENKYNSNETISIKTTNSKMLCLGDMLRFYDYDFEKFIHTIIIIKYTNNNNMNKITEIIQINYTKELHTFLFGTVKREQLLEYNSYVKSIPKNIEVSQLNVHRKNALETKNKLEMKTQCI